MLLSAAATTRQANPVEIPTSDRHQTQLFFILRKAWPFPMSMGWLPLLPEPAALPVRWQSSAVQQRATQTSPSTCSGCPRSRRQALLLGPLIDPVVYRLVPELRILRL